MLRIAAFMIGLVALWVAVGSPLAAMDHYLLTAHMAQHLLLMTVAAPLILWGARSIIPAQAWPGRHPHPVFCWFAGTATVIVWHIPALFELGMHSGAWHHIESGSFLLAGFLFWWPVVPSAPALATWPRWGIPVYLFLATLPCDALSAFLAFCDRVVYPHYASAHSPWNISPLTDQATAGALMWVWVTFAYLAPAAVVTLQILSPQHSAVDAGAV